MKPIRPPLASRANPPPDCGEDDPNRGERSTRSRPARRASVSVFLTEPVHQLIRNHPPARRKRPKPKNRLRFAYPRRGVHSTPMRMVQRLTGEFREHLSRRPAVSSGKLFGGDQHVVVDI